jgi:hypothetical protein
LHALPGFDVFEKFEEKRRQVDDLTYGGFSFFKTVPWGHSFFELCSPRKAEVWHLKKDAK